MFLLDSCICIDFIRGKNPLIKDKLEDLYPSQIKIPSIVEAQLYLGAYKSKDPVRQFSWIEQFLTPFGSLPFDSKCAFEYGKLRADLESVGQRIGFNDMFIAATAIANNAILVTNNVNEFTRVPGLMVESWSEEKI